MKLNNYHIPTAAYFIIAALFIAYFFPREGKFRYQFYEGKPWKYGLLTAPSDFPIYKTDEEIKIEKDSVLKAFRPYYRLNKEIQAEKIEEFQRDYQNKFYLKLDPSYKSYIEKSLTQLYDKGIVSTADYERLKEEHYDYVHLLENSVARMQYTSDFFMVKSAYEFIIDNCPSHLDKRLLQDCDINNYLIENVTYEPSTSEKVKEEMLRNISVASGMVQAGERIVDRGEIVDNHTYNVLRSLKTIHEAKTGGQQRQSIIIVGLLVLIFGFVSSFWLYLWSFRLRIFHNKRSVLFMTLCLFVSCVVTELCVTYSLFNVYIIPLAIVPIVVRTFFDSRTALFLHMVISLICALMVPFPHEFLTMQLIAGMVVTFSLKDLSERSQLIRSAFLVFLAYVLVYLGITLYQEGDLQKINWLMLLYFGINFILLTFSYILVYLLEKTFGYVSNITLVELSSINTPILKKLSETCPGTFQHSLQVSILASAAADKIGANTQLVRTGALYHDIGKMANPAFFTENQSSVNPHESLAFDQSAQIIINHVNDGVKIAEKANLPKAIIYFIRTHHGRGKAKFFYNSFKNKYPDREIDEELFTYPGPNPFTKETAILMMADSVEAASRSLKEHTEESISALVNKIVDSQIADGLLKNAPLTFKDVEAIKTIFTDKLKTMFHTRVSYPDLKKP